MRKIMEVFAADNGLITKKQIKTYHLFSTSVEEETESVSIATAKDAFIFLCNFFADTLKIDRRKRITATTMDEVIEFRLMLEDEDPDKVPLDRLMGMFANAWRKEENRNFMRKFFVPTFDAENQMKDAFNCAEFIASEIHGMPIVELAAVIQSYTEASQRRAKIETLEKVRDWTDWSINPEMCRKIDRNIKELKETHNEK